MFSCIAFHFHNGTDFFAGVFGVPFIDDIAEGRKLVVTLSAVHTIIHRNKVNNNTIMENIRIGRKDATDEEVIAAAKLANCDEFAVKLPDGYSSMIGENGCELSGGERQRISIARAFLKNAPIILLDEATASLDVENETLIQAALVPCPLDIPLHIPAQGG